jgi:hypothetical protein
MYIALDNKASKNKVGKISKYTVIRESFLNRQMASYVFNLIWRKGYYGAYRTPGILRPFLFFFMFFSSFTYERKREKVEWETETVSLTADFFSL